MGAMTLQKLWTKDEIQIVRNLAEQGKSASQIGDAIKRTRNAVMGVAFRNGIKLLNQKVKGQTRQKPTARRGDHLKKPPLMEKQREAKHEELLITAPSGENNVPFLDRRYNQCKFIIGRTEKEHYCCGEPVDRKGWCKYHASIVYRPPDPKPQNRDGGSGPHKAVSRFAK